MRLDVITIFPDYLAPLGLSLLGRAQAEGRLDVRVHDLRAYTHDRHRTVDDAPYGGGAGMLMRPEPWGEALDDVLASPPADPPLGDTPGPVLVVPTPAGERLTQSVAAELAEESWLVFACGRYEGIDARVVEHARTRVRVREISLGDYVLAGGEAAVLVIAEAVVRLLPGVLGNETSLAEESHVDGLLESPSFTKPPRWRGLEVPPVLRSGDHAAVRRWRRTAALRRTAQVRPDLVAALDARTLDAADLAVLAELGWSPTDRGEFRWDPPPVAH